MAKEVRLEKGERITVTKLGIQASKEFAKTQFADTPHAKKVVLMVDGALDEYVKFVDTLTTSEIKAALVVIVADKDSKVVMEHSPKMN